MNSFSNRTATGRGARGHRRGFALRDAMAMMGCLALAGMMGCMWINDSYTTTRGNSCLNNIRQLALGVANHESANGRFLLASDATAPLHEVAPGTLGDDTTDSSGYSWLVRVLPYIEERILYDEISRSSEKFGKRTFDSALVRADAAHFSTTQVPAYRCPAYSGDNTVPPGFGSEYDDLAFAGREPALTNFMAIVGTHANADGTINENGVIVSRCENADGECDGQGLRLRDVADGSSNTIILCETREPVYAAWMDGQATWVVGFQSAGAGMIGGDELPTGTATMIGRQSYSAIALAGGWPGRVARDWGPSSEHAGGVHHAFADCHAQFISADIDPTVYYRLITRAGGEAVGVDGL